MQVNVGNVGFMSWKAVKLVRRKFVVFYNVSTFFVQVQQIDSNCVHVGA